MPAKTNGSTAVAEPEQDPTIEITRIASERILVPVVGTSPLIVHNFSQKSRQKMLDKQQGIKTPTENRDPEADYQSSFYRTADGYGFPAAAFKKAMVGAARFYSGVKMTQLRQFVFFHGTLTEHDTQQLIPIVGEPRMREDTVRLSGPTRTADIRYRAEFPEWSVTLDVTYVTTGISRGSVLSLIDASGMGIGVGEWRPERSGEFGCFQIDPTREIEVIG